MPPTTGIAGCPRRTEIKNNVREKEGGLQPRNTGPLQVSSAVTGNPWFSVGKPPGWVRVLRLWARMGGEVGRTPGRALDRAGSSPVTQVWSIVLSLVDYFRS